MSARTLSFPKAVNETLHRAMEQDSSVIVMGEDIGRFGGMFRCTEGLFERFGEKRVWDTPISEAGFIGMGLGAALTGKRPVVEIMFIDFAFTAADQLLNQVAKTHLMSGGTAKAPMVIRTQGGGYKGAASQHSQMLETVFVHVPGLKVVAPSSPHDAKGLLNAAIRDDNPVLFIEHKQLYGASGDVPEEDYTIPLGKAAVVRPGDDLTIFSYSYTLTMALHAAETLASSGISAEVVDLRTLNPLDWETISDSVSKTHRVLVAHESYCRCGIGADLAAQIQEKLFDELDAPILRVSGADTPIPFAKALEEAALPSVDKIIAAAKRLVN
jgi:pyruvate dehydrogenase E1 component beta subunit